MPVEKTSQNLNQTHTEQLRGDYLPLQHKPIEKQEIFHSSFGKVTLPGQPIKNSEEAHGLIEGFGYDLLSSNQQQSPFNEKHTIEPLDISDDATFEVEDFEFTMEASEISESVMAYLKECTSDEIEQSEHDQQSIPLNEGDAIESLDIFDDGIFEEGGFEFTMDSSAIYEEVMTFLHDSRADKYAKHHEIAKDVVDPNESFKAGDEQKIGSYIKLGLEKIQTQELVLGPAKRTAETAQMKQIINRLLENLESVDFIEEDGKIFAIMDGQKINFSEALKNVDFNHIKLSEKSIANYHSLLNSNKMAHKPQVPGSTIAPTPEFFKHRDPQGLCAVLSQGEKEAINVYTGGAYRSINYLLRGSAAKAISSFSEMEHLPQEEMLNPALKEILLHTAVAVSALNKLPDYKPPPNEYGKVSKYLYRGESPTLQDSVLELKKEKVQ